MKVQPVAAEEGPLKVHAVDLHFETPGEVTVRDITGDLAKVIASSGVSLGQAQVFTTSSTSAITTLEHEPGLVEEDLPGALERLFPKHGEGVDYGHQRMWGDGNGHSHVRAAFLGPSLTVPVRDGAPLLGRWEQVVFVELDNKPRDRRVSVHVMGVESE